MNTFDLSQTDRLLMTTPAVRKRLDLERPVEREVVMDCLQVAMYAPNAANTQLWRWLVITDPAKREQIAGVYRRLFDERVRSVASTPDSEGGTGRRYGGDEITSRNLSAADYLAENLHRVPVHVIPCYPGRPNSEGSNVELSSMYGSILQAVWSFQLALRSRGLGSVWTTMHLHSEHEVAQLLGIPDDFTQVALIPLAYTIGADFAPPPRQPAEEVTYWNEWPLR
jgi:nitroreductase